MWGTEFGVTRRAHSHVGGARSRDDRIGGTTEGGAPCWGFRDSAPRRRGGSRRGGAPPGGTARARRGMAAAAAAAAETAAVAAEDGGGAAPCAGAARAARLPLSRVKALVKADPDVSLASQEAVFVLARAAVRSGAGPGRAELFVETIAKDAFVYAQQGKRKTLQRKDLDNAIEAVDEFAFLEGFSLGNPSSPPGHCI
ncbi:DNA polymerase epsilon subunit 4 isoform X6 [Gallus gallus]|uniref:DNA polymerase epsilon subunit 4 isoform X6 n=1 Tax=Gallus gallus TaxID=9031 RepID=UPI001AE972CD|nr:DNA polymerase epsilon subunit 4 isoform X6 [Gallus gallus]